MAKKLVGTMKLQVPAGQANPIPTRRPSIGSARHQHHGILQGVQRQDAGHGARRALPDRDHLLSGQVLSMEIKTPPASYYLKKAAKLKSGSKRPAAKLSVRSRPSKLREIAEAKMERPERKRHRSRDEDHRRFCTLYGHRGEVRWQNLENVPRAAREAFAGKANVSVEDAVALVKDNANVEIR